MGKAKLRAERRREAREASAPQDTRKKYGYLTVLISTDVIEQIRMRYAFLAGQFPDRSEFVTALLQAGMDVCDQDVNAVLRYHEGKAKPIDPTTESKEERLVLSPNEVPEDAKKVLAAVSPVGYVGRRTAQ